MLVNECEKLIRWPIDCQFLWYRIFTLQHHLEHFLAEAGTLTRLMNVKVKHAHGQRWLCIAVLIEYVQVFHANFEQTCYTTTLCVVCEKKNSLERYIFNDDARFELHHRNAEPATCAVHEIARQTVSINRKPFYSLAARLFAQQVDDMIGVTKLLSGGHGLR